MSNQPLKEQGAIRSADDWAWHLEEVRAEMIRYQSALNAIATGDGYYGKMAREYKNIARTALRMERLP